MAWYVKLALIYFAAISVVTIIVTVYDKAAAKAGKWRIPEATLLLLGLFGGALGEYAIMKIIRHKTKHKRFMLLLPAEIILHAVLVGVALYLS